MKDVEELPELMKTIIDGTSDTEDDNEELKFTDEAIKAIHEIADYARETEIYKSTRSAFESFWEHTEKTVYNAYMHMIHCVVNAPSELHRDSSVMLLIPAIADLIDEENAKSE